MKAPLWSRLQNYHLDDPDAAFRFSHRLAQENGWSRTYAHRVLEEYKRFLYLCCEAGHPVTPSDAVDQAWHLHLCYTRSYWNDLCRDVLRMPLHHGPTKGGPSERAKFREWYNRTLASYREHFGDDPPRDIWPPARERFRPRAERRLDLATHFVISKRTCYRLLAVALGTLVLAGCSLSERGAEFLTALLTLGAVFVLIAVLFSKRGKGGCGGAGGCGGTGSNNSGGDSGCASGCGGGGGCGGGCGGG